MTRIIESNYPGLFRPMTTAMRESLAFGGEPLSEAMSTSDFPLLMGDILDRSLLARFNEQPPVWRDYINVGMPLRDFRDIRMLQTDGGNEEWTIVSEHDGIDYTVISESGYTMHPDLYGKGVKLSWRMLINDDLDAFREIPAILGRGGRHTLHKFATDLLFDANGPDATFISVANGNRLTGNPDFAIDSLGTAIQQFMTQTDSAGQPISIEGVRLVYGPGLHVVVQNVLNTLTIDQTEAGGLSGRTIRVNNWLVRGITPVMDPYIPIIATTNGATSWLLVAAPSVARPAAKVRFLQGFDAPALFQKQPNTLRVGGGLDSGLGDFDSMSQEYKGLLAFGGLVMEPKAVLGSNGSNT